MNVASNRAEIKLIHAVQGALNFYIRVQSTGLHGDNTLLIQKLEVLLNLHGIYVWFDEKE